MDQKPSHSLVVPTSFATSRRASLASSGPSSRRQSIDLNSHVEAVRRPFRPVAALGHEYLAILEALQRDDFPQRAPAPKPIAPSEFASSAPFAYHVNPLQRLSRDDVQVLDARGIVVLRKEQQRAIAQKEPDIPIQRQGDLAWYTDDALAQRDGIRFAKSFLAATREWWDTALETQSTLSLPSTSRRSSIASNLEHFPLRPEDAMGRVHRTTYTKILLLVAHVLMPKVSAHEAAMLAEDDCAVDFGKDEEMDLPRFHDALYQLADLWTMGATCREYCRFLDDLLDVITQERGSSSEEEEEEEEEEDHVVPKDDQVPTSANQETENKDQASVSSVATSAATSRGSTPPPPKKPRKKRSAVPTPSPPKQRRRQRRIIQPKRPRQRRKRRILISPTTLHTRTATRKRKRFTRKYAKNFQHVGKHTVASDAGAWRTSPDNDDASPTVGSLHADAWKQGGGRMSMSPRFAYVSDPGSDPVMRRDEGPGFQTGGAFAASPRWEDAVPAPTVRRRPVHTLPYFRDLFGRYWEVRPVIPSRPIATTATVYRNMGTGYVRRDGHARAVSVRAQLRLARQGEHALLEAVDASDRSDEYASLLYDLRTAGWEAASRSSIQRGGARVAVGNGGIPVAPGVVGATSTGRSASAGSAARAHGRVARSRLVLTRRSGSARGGTSASTRSAARRLARSESACAMLQSKPMPMSRRTPLAMTLDAPFESRVMREAEAQVSAAARRLRPSSSLSHVTSSHVPGVATRPATASGRVLGDFATQLQASYGVKERQRRRVTERRRVRYSARH